jgi:hypothetical protein
VLLLIPLAVFVTIDYLYRTMAGARMRLSAGLVAIVCIQALSAALIAPHYLSYFNRMFGGPSEGYRYLADSNVDWGQDLPALRETLARVGAKRPLLSYFGSAPPEAYGVHATPWMAGSPSSPESFDWIAISATNLDGVYLTDDPFAPFRDVSPSARAAYSLLLYATDRPDVQRAMAATSARLLR